MSYLERIHISGIRSFGPDKPQTVIFHTPLTLIVGQNGSGKTTLIECLRYMSTGDVPASTAGARNANFAHDCNINDIDGCKSQVKLRFFDINQSSVIAIRSMNSSRKKTAGGQTKIECKSVDGILRKVDKRTNEPQSMPTKCADMNREMSILLGVSDAVLNNVIFCHQEDSTWPLSEPKALKMRFDEIFAATKYMKVLDAMNQEKKELAKNVSEYKKELPHLLRFKEHAKTSRDQIKTEEAQLQGYVDEIARNKAKIEPIKAKLDEIGRHRAEIDRLRSTLGTLKSDKNATENTIKELRAHINEFYEGDIEELKRDIERFDVDQKRIMRELSDRKRDLEQLERQEHQLNKQKGDLLTKKGKLEADIQNNEAQVDRRDKEMVEFSKQFGIHGFSKAPFSDAKVTEYYDAMQQKIVKANDEMAKEKTELEKRLREAKTDAELASNALAKNEEAIASKDSMLLRTEKDIKETRNFLSDMDNRQARLGELGKDISKLENDLAKASSQINENALKDEIAKLQADRNSADAKMRSLNEELKTANRESNLRLELEMLQKEKATKDDNLQKLMDKHRDGLNEHFRNVNTSRLRDAIDDEVIRRSKQLQASNQKLSDCKLTQKSKEQERDMRNADLKTKERELREAEEKIEKVLSGDAVDEELEKLRETMEKLQFEKGTADGSENIYKAYIKKLEARPCCPLCERNFSEKKDATNLSDKLKREIKQLPEKVASLRQRIEEQQKRQTDLLQLQPVVELANNLKTKDIPALRKRIDELNADIRAVKKDITELENIIAIQTDDEQTVKIIQGDVGQIEALHNEIQALDRRVAEQKEKVGPDSNIRSTDTIDSEIVVIQMNLDDIADSLTSKQEKLSSYRDKVQHFRQKINDLTKEKLEITDAMQQQIAYQEKLSTLTTQRDQCRQELEELRRKTQSLKRNLDELRGKERQCESAKEERMRDHQKRLQTLENAQRIIMESNESIRKFQSSGKREQFDECIRKVESIENDIADNSRRSTTMTQQNEDQDRALSERKIKMRDLEDSLKVKEKEKSIQELLSKIAKCSGDLDRLGGLAGVGREYDEFGKQYSDLTKELASTEGKKEKLEENLAQKRQQLRSEGYKDADENYEKKLVELVTTEVALTDLTKYYKALDNAVIQYHSSKMEAVNDTLRELWGKIYKHNDIDYIAIKSAEAESTDKRRAYNYRVVMRSGGAELDMRGRCSAGQKVLASLLIRIALADVFSTNCGILALDEPTTNLDVANIEGLAQALVDLIEDRSQQKNFQLLLITHDENFVRMLLQGYPMEKHYRVEKDENGFSVISETRTSDLY